MIPDVGLILLVGLVVALTVWRPGAAVMSLGVFLFVQSAVIRLDPLDPQIRELMRRADEPVLAVLLLRTVSVQAFQRSFTVPRPLWALAAFAGIGAASATVNLIGPAQTAVALFLAVKGGLWLYVGRSLRLDERAIVQYGIFIGALFIGAVAIAILQVMGVTMPWSPGTRSGQITATSIWNQHTAFGAALTVAVALSVAALRLPGERVGGFVLLVASGTGIVLSTVRRLLVSMPVAAVATMLAMPGGVAARLRQLGLSLRRRTVLAWAIIGMVVLAIAIGPRLISLAEFTWQRYVIELEGRDRYLLYEGALHLVQESPLLGRGPGSYGSYASVIFESPAYDEVGFIRRDSVKMAAPYGSLIAEYGILGVLAFGTFVVLLFRALLPIARSVPGSLQVALATAGLFMIVDLTIESFVNPVFSSSFITFFTFVGIGAAMGLNARQVTKEPLPWDSRAIGRRSRAGIFVAAQACLMLLVGIVTVLVNG